MALGVEWQVIVGWARCLVWSLYYNNLPGVVTRPGPRHDVVLWTVDNGLFSYWLKS